MEFVISEELRGLLREVVGKLGIIISIAYFVYVIKINLHLKKYKPEVYKKLSLGVFGLDYWRIESLTGFINDRGAEERKVLYYRKMVRASWLLLCLLVLLLALLSI